MNWRAAAHFWVTVGVASGATVVGLTVARAVAADGTVALVSALIALIVLIAVIGVLVGMMARDS